MSTKLSKCPACGTYDISRVHVADHAGKMDTCKRCNTQWPTKPGTLTADQMTSADSPIALSADMPSVILAATTEPGKPILVLGKFPPKVNGADAHYYRKEVARARETPYTHRGQKVIGADGKTTFDTFQISHERMDKWVDAFKGRSAAGIKPFVPERHVAAAADARTNFGYVVDLERQGDGLFGTFQLIGDDAEDVASRNDVSIYVTSDAADANGGRYEECIEHVCLTPNPAIPDLGPFVKIAASADTPARDVPVFELAGTQPNPAPSRKGSKMKAELAQQVRAKLGIGADVTDEQIDDACATKALALSADLATKTSDLASKATALATLTTERDALKTERDAAKADVTAKEQQVLSLSSDVPTNDPLALTLIARAFKTDREQVIASGVISEAGMKEVDALLISNGKPTRQALALSAGSTDPFYSRLCEILRKHPGIKTNNSTQRPPGITPAIAASGDNGEMTIEQMAVAAAKATMKQHYPSATVAAK